MSRGKTKQTYRALRTTGVVFFALILVLLLISAGLQIAYAQRIYPNTYIGHTNISGLTPDQAESLLQNKWDSITKNGLEFLVEASLPAEVPNQSERRLERGTIFPFINSPDNPDQSLELVYWQPPPDIALAFNFGHENSLMPKIISSLKSLFTSRHYAASVEINNKQITEVLRQNFGHIETPAHNAAFSYEAGEIKTTPAQVGQAINYAQGLKTLEQNLANLIDRPVRLSLAEDMPNIQEQDILKFIPEAKQLIERAPFSLALETQETYGVYTQTWTLSKDVIASSVIPAFTNGDIGLILDQELRSFLEDIASDINRPALDAKFDIDEESGKIAKFQGSKDGLELDIQTSLDIIAQSIIRDNKPTSTLAVNLIKPQVTTEDANNLGIKELIGSGKSNFSGSPTNRRINIKVSSDKLNGLLIPPGSEFSLVEALKPFTAQAGYVPDLVIKGNKLIPEIGGGACQIGTTTFRAALSSGLEITQRRNHSFAVSYYNDENGLPGTDATIYDPAPDFKFRNNTDSHILIQTKIDEETDDLIYEFWGTSDGRVASTTIPQILNRIPAPETKYIETEDLAPGVTKCSGSNVPGYHTSFTYIVEKPDGTSEEKVYESRYRPWQKVCLIGVEQSPSLEEGE